MVFYRQKMLLSLIELNGRSLRRTDLQKLLFLFCIEQNEFYQFFPYKYGAFSHMSYHDKKKLIDAGYLQDCNDFMLTRKTQFASKIKPKHHIALQRFSIRHHDLRGKELIRYTYLKYPKFTCKSAIFSDHLSEEEQEEAQLSWNHDNQQTLFTIGYEGNTIDNYLYRLITNNVNALIDVRKNPLSRKHGFSAKKMKQYIENAGITYYHFPELGIASDLRKNLGDQASYESLFNLYAVQTIPNQTVAIQKICQLMQEHKRIALTCFEAEAHMCHRHKIVEAITQTPHFDTPIKHI